MNFEQAIYPLTEFLFDNNFLVAYREQHFIRYFKNSTTITVAYASLEYLFYTHVGQNSKSLIELTPAAIKTVFNDDSFQFQSTLTIDNLISFFKGKGKSIVSGHKDVFQRLIDFSDQQSKEFTKELIQLQNIQGADKAWRHKDYLSFIRCIDRTDKELVPESYLKKYKIAVDKSRKQIE